MSLYSGIVLLIIGFIMEYLNSRIQTGVNDLVRIVGIILIIVGIILIILALLGFVLLF